MTDQSPDRIDGPSHPAEGAAERRAQDRAIVAAILAGEEGSFARLHALYAPRILGFALRLLGDPMEAEDVVQDVFVEVHRCLASWEGRSSLLGWIYGIAHHQLCRRFRKRRPLLASDELLEAAAPKAESGAPERRLDAQRRLRVCAESLEEDASPAQREIFSLYYSDCLPTREIARRLGKSNQAVKISLFRARRAMASRLEAQELLQSA